jgi:hypothetical protein
MKQALGIGDAILDCATLVAQQSCKSMRYFENLDAQDNTLAALFGRF